MTDKSSIAPQETSKPRVYRADETPPAGILFFSSLQQMLLALSLSMSLPVVISAAAGLDFAGSSSLMAAALFSIGIVGILQTVPGRFIGSGLQSISAADTATIAACVMAAELGGVPLVLGMSIFSCVLRFILGSFTSKIRKLFPPEVTGTMIFILGINLVPTGFKYFLGSSAEGAYDPHYLFVSVSTLLFMLTCSLFIKKLRPYSALAGIVFGFAVYALSGMLDPAQFHEMSKQPAISLPIYNKLSYSFDAALIVPFIVVTVAAVIDNIGDFSATQKANDPKRKKTDWSCVERGIRGGALGTLISVFIGGPLQATATTNIGIASATGITSRKVAYVSSALFILVSFFPRVAGLLSIIPQPVLGAVLLYSMCYIMAGGFSTLTALVLDDRRIFVVFLSVGFAASALIPGLYSFLPEDVEKIVASPMICGVGILLLMTLFVRIGTKKRVSFSTGVGSEDIIHLNKELENLCRQWSAERDLLRSLQISMDALCEGIYEIDPATKLHFNVLYDNLQLKMSVKSSDSAISETCFDEITNLSVTILMLKNMFDNVDIKYIDNSIAIKLDVDM